MGQYATTVEEQIKLLKTRGMLLDLPIDKVKEILLDIGYYRLGFYWHPFVKDKDHNFIEDAKFSEVVGLYYFDSDLRHVLTKYLNRIEVNFKTKLIYEVSNHYRSKPTWFADHSVMEKDFIAKLPSVYDNKFKSNNSAIKAHHAKYINHIYAPAWKTIEFLPFGSILKIYKNLKNEDLQKKISNQYGVRNHHFFISHITHLIQIRNLCAHGGQLYDLRLSKGITSIYDLKFRGNERTNLKGVCVLVEYYLAQISQNRKNDFINDVKKNLDKNRTLKEIIETKAGL